MMTDVIKAKSPDTDFFAIFVEGLSSIQVIVAAIGFISAAAFAGFSTYKQGLPPKLGYIGEIKKMRIEHLPAVGDTLHTHLTILGEAAGITLLAAETKVADTIVAAGQMKIFIKND